MNRLYIFLFVTCILSLEATAQERRTPREGEIEEGQVIISKELNLELPPADRNFEKAPPAADLSKTDESTSYDFNFLDNSRVPDLTPTLRVLKIKTDKPVIPYSNYLKAGIGNYISPYLGVYLHNAQSDELAYGASLLHYSAAHGPVDKRNSGDGHTQVRLNGKYMTGQASVGARMGYDLDVYRFYGYDESIEVDRDTLKQVFNRFNAELNFENINPEAPIKVRSDLRFSHIGDRFDHSENAFNIFVSGHYKVQDDIGAGMDIDLDFRKYKSSIADLDRNYVSVTPFISLDRRPLFIKAGFRIVSQNDSLDNVNDIALYPTARADYHVSENFIVYGILDGNVERYNFTSNADINPYIGMSNAFYNTNKRLEFGGGIKGKALQNIAFDARATVARYRNLFFFVNDTIETNKFNILYDTDEAAIFTLHGAVSYSQSKLYGAEFTLDYRAYETRQLEQAWHRPTLDLGLNGWYNIYEKIIVSSHLNYLAGIKALDPVSRESVTLKPAFDWNAEINYLLSEKAGVFLMLNNIISNNYELLYRYPVRGLQVRLGVTVNF